jgi:hypothetical protein
MLASSSVLSRFANRLFGRTTGRRHFRRADLTRRDRTPVFHAAEVMEERALLSATLGAALSIGNDTGKSSAFGVAADSAGNSYVTGAFSGTVDFDQGGTHAGDSDILTARGSGDVFVAKYAADNSLLWVQRMGGDADIPPEVLGVTDVGRKIEVDGSGNVYVVGDFRESADFGATTLSTAGDPDGFVVKLNAGGTIQWARDWGTTANDWGAGVDVDSSGNVYALGSRATAGYDMLKFNSAGTSLWSKSITTGTAVGGGLAVDGTGNVFVAGSFRGTTDFDPGFRTRNVSSGPGGAGFALKLDTNGNFKWVSPFVGRTVGSSSGYSAGQSVALDGSGNVLVGGYYRNTVDFNPGSGTSTLPAIGGGYIAKLNSSGGLVWARALENSSTTFVYGLAADSAGNVYASGLFQGTIDLNPGAGIDARTSAGGDDIFVVKLTSAGNYSWAETFGGTGADTGFGIAVDPTGGVHLAGYYEATVDFDPDPLNTYYLTAPARNAFRLRLEQV